MRKTLLMMLCLCMGVVQLWAQVRTITGKVADASGTPVSGASVTVKGTQLGTVTKADGSFSLAINTAAKTLVISAVGIENKEVAISEKANYEISVVSTSNNLEEVVVVGYGSGRKRANVVGAVATVDAKRIQERPSANAFDALQGKVAGLQVFTSSGEPSATPTFRIHGVGSLGGGSTPLIVMDGIPVGSGTIVSLNPEDFETINVLKDASATSIYGAQAANGVIYITTKKGSVNKPASITLQTQYAVSDWINNTKDFYNSFMNTKELTDYWVATGYRRRGQVDTLLRTYKADTDWEDVYYKRNVPSYQANLAVSGGGGKTSYHISGSYFKQEGMAYRSDFERYTLRSNVTTTVNSWLKIGLNLSGGYDKRQTNQYGSNQLNRGLAMLTQPFYSAVDTNGKRYDFMPGVNRYHPEYLANNILSEGSNLQFNPTGYVQLNPIKNLTLKTQAGMDFYDYRVSGATLPSYLGSLNNGSVSEAWYRNVNRTITNTAEYLFKVADDHQFALLAGQEFRDNNYAEFTGSSAGQTDDRLLLIGAGPNNRNASSAKNQYSFASYFGRLEYTLMNNYYLTGTFRQDQSSRFGRDNRTARFWSVGAMWKAKSEKFLKDISWLDELTLRTSYGTSGNSDIGNYQSLAQVGTNLYGEASGWNINAAGNSQLSWETQKQFNVSVDLGVFDKVRTKIEFYNRVTSNMLISVPYPYTSGFANITSNVGALQNNGIDFTLDFDIIKTRNAYITPYVNFNYNWNKVTELFQGKQYWIIPNTGVSWAVGQPVSFFYPVWAGVDPTNGNPQWYLPNENPDMIVNNRQDPKAVTSSFSAAALQQSTGINRQAPFNGGFGLAAGFKAFSLQMDWSFSQGKYLINNDRYFFENPTQFAGYNQAKNITDYWKQPGDVTRYPRYGVQFTQFDSRLIEDASFLRMKAITLAYDLPATLAKRTGFIKGSKLYVTARNLVTFTKYTGPDPEVDSNLTLGVNPNTQQLAVGLNFTF